MNIPSSSSGRRPPESVSWTGSDPPKLPKHWLYLLPLSMTHEVELWGSSLLALLVKELVIRYSAMSDPNAHEIVTITEQATNKKFVALIVQQLAGMKTSPDKSVATTCIRNLFAFVFEEYGFGGARAWARHLFEERIEDLCKNRRKKEGKPADLCVSPTIEMQQTDTIFALPSTYPAITPFNEAVLSPLLIAAIHDKSYHPQLPPLTDASWDDVYARNGNRRSYSSALENLGDAILRWILAQVARKTIPTLTAEGTLRLSYTINSNVVYGNIAQRLRLHKNARESADLRLGTPGNVVLQPIKQYADLFETMVGAYWVQPGVTYEDVFNWTDVTFRPLIYAAEWDVRNDVKSKKNEGARSKTENRDANVTTSIIRKVGRVLAPVPPAPFQPIRPIRPGPVTRSNAARPSAGQPPQPAAVEEETVAVMRPPPRPTKKIRYERTGPVLNLPQEVVDLTMLD